MAFYTESDMIIKRPIQIEKKYICMSFYFTVSLLFLKPYIDHTVKKNREGLQKMN